MDRNLKSLKSNDSSNVFIFVLIVIAILFIYFWMDNSSSQVYKKPKEDFIQSNAAMIDPIMMPITIEDEGNKIEEDEYEEEEEEEEGEGEEEEVEEEEVEEIKSEPFTHMNDYELTDDNIYTNNINSEELNNPVNNLTNDNNVNISGFLNGDVSCNMDQMQKELVNDYKKKYFNMYKHQIECPKDCLLHNMKRCNLNENNDCQGIVTSDYNNPDVFTLGFLALDKNNKKKCVSCTSNDDRQTRYMKSDLQVNSENDEVEVNRRRFDNRNKFADFNNYIEQNGVMETSVDKLAEVRTCTTGTCGLETYGRKVSDVYDNLLSTTYTTNKKNCNPGMISGISENASATSYAEPLN